MAEVTVLGAGSWGVALGIVADSNGHRVRIWSHNPEEARRLNEEHELKDKLPGVKLSESIVFTGDIAEALRGANVVVIAVPSSAVRETAKKIAPYATQDMIMVDVAKGIEADSLLTMSGVVEDEIPGARTAVLSGPSHAEEVSRKLPTTVVSASSSRRDAEYVQSVFMNDFFRVYTSPDVLGVGLGGSLKNVIALAAGMADGLGYGDNTKAALITRGIKEVSALAMKMGARRETIEGLSGMGDLIVTCASMHSRNRRAGILIGQGRTPDEAMKEVKMVVEGVHSAKAAGALGRKYDVQLPIIDEVNEVLFSGKDVKEGVYDLMQRDRKSEHTHLEWEKE
ncbi:MAG: NAD(P)H-dependent glycerol-3-phosphate dehydrogenase [Eubacterium sp.]|nr:NAD(P)H-dependent glycerol-3-phosphate dehydrogenase [Eubacterium sp.]